MLYDENKSQCVSVDLYIVAEFLARYTTHKWTTLLVGGESGM